MESEFDRDTAVRPLGDGRYDADVVPGWDVGPAPNGGYVLALAARAALAEAAHPDPVTVTGHYLGRTEHGPARIAVDVAKAGRAMSTAEARLVQEGRERLRLLATFADLGVEPARPPALVDGAPPELPPPEECVPHQPRLPGGIEISIARRLDARYHPRTVGWVVGRPTERAEVGGWIRFTDGREPDPLSLLLFCDGWAPPLLATGVSGWVPTVELTVHVRARPAPGWLRCWVRTRFVTGWFVEEDCEVWDSRDRLVAMSRQLARLPVDR